MDFYHLPFGPTKTGLFLIEQFQSKNWTEFKAAIAFVKQSGTRHITDHLKFFAQNASSIQISIGIDQQGTSIEGLADLLEAISNKGQIWVVHNPIPSTFHPKIYLFRNKTNASLLVGSNNLTEGGLFTNYEASIHIPLDLSIDTHKKLITDVENTLTLWSQSSEGQTALLLNQALLQTLANQEYILSENKIAEKIKDETISQNTTRLADAKKNEGRLFFPDIIPRPPTPHKPKSKQKKGAPLSKQDDKGEKDIFLLHTRNFLMTLQQTDVGKGQKTKGTSRRSPEIFIPLEARDYAKEFWGWPEKFIESETNFNRSEIKIRLGTDILSVTMMVWKKKHDFRIRNEKLRNAGEIGDIIRIEKVMNSKNFEYYVEIIPKGTSHHGPLKALCINRPRNSEKEWGYY